MRKIIFPSILLVVSLACALPGISAPAAAPLPTFDPNSIEIIIVETAAAAQTQTALKLPTATHTPKPTHTPSLTPTFTPTFFFSLSTFTPIPTFTVPVTVSAGDVVDSDEDEGEEGGKKEKKDPQAMTGREWTCTVLGTYPPRNSVFEPDVRFNVKWTLFNSGTKEWVYYGVDLVYAGGLRHEGTKIQDFNRSVPSGGEIQVGAVFVTPKKAGEYSTFFNLMVGKREFCKMTYYFTVTED